METLLGYYTQFMEISKANPIVASVLGVGLGGTLLLWVRGTPAKLWQFFQNWFSYSIVIDGSNNGTNGRLMKDLSLWVSKYAIRALIRRYMIRQWWSDETSEWLYEPILGLGTHYVWYKHRLVVVEVSRRESQGSEYEKYTYGLRFYTSNRSVIDTFLTDIQHQKNPETIDLYRAGGMRWGESKAIRKRPIETVALNETTRAQVMSAVTEFVDSKEWYFKHSISYKLCMVLEGPSGTGKTSLAKSIAAWLSRNIYTLSLNGVSDDGLLKLFSEVPKGSVVLIEDFDTNDAVSSRTGGGGSKELTISRLADLGFIVTEISEPGGKDPFVVGYVNGERAVILRPSRPIEYVNGDVPDVYPIGSEIGEVIDDYFSQTEPVNPIDSGARYSRTLTLSGILNALDGVDGLEDIIVILSTNHIGNVDEALLRKGRVDHIFRIGLLEDQAIRQYLQSMYEHILLDASVTYAPIKGCDLQDIVLMHKDNPHACVGKLKTLQVKEVNAA